MSGKDGKRNPYTFDRKEPYPPTNIYIDAKNATVVMASGLDFERRPSNLRVDYH